LAAASLLGSRLPADSVITSHAEFHAELKARHGRKYAFWQLVDEQRLPLDGGFNRSGQHLLNFLDEEVGHGDVTDSVHGETED